MIVALWWSQWVYAKEVTVWHAWNGAEEQALTQIADDFEQRTGHSVVLVPVPMGILESKFETSVPTGNGPDIVIFAHGKRAQWVSAEWVVPITLEDVPFFPAAQTAVEQDQQAWAMPLTVKGPLLLYDPEVIEQPPKTTEQLLRMAKQLTDQQHYGFGYEMATPYYHAAWVHGFGGDLFSDSGADLTSLEQLRALEWVVELAKAEVGPSMPTGERLGALYDQGRLAMIMSGPWFAVDRSRPIAAAPLPILSETGLLVAPYLTVEAAWLTPTAGSEARALVSWLGSVEAGERLATIGGQVPARRDIPLTTTLQLAMAEQAKYSIPMPSTGQLGLGFEAEARALRRALRGAVTPEEALAEANSWYQRMAYRPKTAASPWPVCLSLLGIAGFALSYWRRHRRAESGERFPWGWVMPALLSVGALVVVPFLAGATVAFFAHEHNRWTFVGWANFIDILSPWSWPLGSPLSFYNTLFVTVLWTVINVMLHVGIGVGLAFLLREPWLRLRGMWRTIFILPWAIPNYITAMIWRSMFDTQFGAINQILSAVSGTDVELDWFARFGTAFAANIATNTWLGFPFMMVVTLGALQAIPRELEEAAALDGASGWQRFRWITWPLLWPALMPAVALGSVWTFNMFNVVFLVSKGEPEGATEILISQAYRWAFSRGYQFGYASAYALIVFGVLLLFSRFNQRFTMGNR